jgi:hypothetical protein
MTLPIRLAGYATFPLHRSAGKRIISSALYAGKTIRHPSAHVK